MNLLKKILCLCIMMLIAQNAPLSAMYRTNPRTGLRTDLTTGIEETKEEYCARKNAELAANMRRTFTPPAPTHTESQSARNARYREEEAARQRQMAELADRMRREELELARVRAEEIQRLEEERDRRRLILDRLWEEQAARNDAAREEAALRPQSARRPSLALTHDHSIIRTRSTF